MTVPTWRRDVEGQADLVEEVARIIGYDAVPSTPLDRAPGVARPTATRSQLMERRVRRTAAARGLDEAVTWSFISDAEAAAFGGGDWQLANPISEEMKVMRPSLLPGLVAAARRNHRPWRRRRCDCSRSAAAIFPTPSIQRSPSFSQASAAGASWQSGKAQSFDAFDAKSEVARAARFGRCPVDNFSFSGCRPNLAPGPLGDAASRAQDDRRGVRRAASRASARTSVLHPAPSRPKSISTRSRQAASGHRVRSSFAPPALQAITRDFAFIVPAELVADVLLRAILGADKVAITGARLFDRFEAPEGLSLAFEVTLQPAEHSFTDEQIGEISRRIVAAAEKLGARLRS